MRKFVGRLEAATDDATIMKLKKQLQTWLEGVAADESAAAGDSPSAADINRALLMGTLGVGDSGFAIADVPGVVSQPDRLAHGMRRRRAATPPAPAPRAGREEPLPGIAATHALFMLQIWGDGPTAVAAVEERAMIVADEQAAPYQDDNITHLHAWGADENVVRRWIDESRRIGTASGSLHYYRVESDEIARAFAERRLEGGRPRHAEPHRVGPWGMVVNGTLLADRLIPHFYAELNRVAPARGARFDNEMRAWRIELDEGETDPDDNEALVQLLVAQLNEVAPTGMYFGAHPDDSSNFGWWVRPGPVQDEDEAAPRPRVHGLTTEQPPINYDDYDEHSIGDDENTASWQVGARPGYPVRYYVRVWFDAPHVTDVITEAGPFASIDQATREGHDIAAGWCIDNDVVYDDPNRAFPGRAYEVLPLFNATIKGDEEVARRAAADHGASIIEIVRSGDEYGQTVVRLRAREDVMVRWFSEPHIEPPQRGVGYNPGTLLLYNLVGTGAGYYALPTADENLERLEQRLIAREEGRTRPPGAFAYRMIIRGNRAQAINNAEQRGFTVIESRALPDDINGIRAGVDAWTMDGDAANDWFGARRGRETRTGTLLHYDDLDESNASVERLTHEIMGDGDRELLGRVRREMLDRHNPFAAGFFDRMLANDVIPPRLQYVQYIDDESFADCLQDCGGFQRDNEEDLEAFYSTHIQPHISEDRMKTAAGECFWVARNHLDDGDNPFDDEYTDTAVVERLFENAREYPVLTVTVVGDLIHVEDREIAYDDLDHFTQAYIAAALWSTNDESTPAGGVLPDENYGPHDIAPDTLRRMIGDCVRFQDENAVDLRDHDDPEQAGHDFWLTREGHGTGFWDRDLGGLGERLSEAARRFGEFNLIVGDDGMIHH
jgi:hypothetical protein